MHQTRKRQSIWLRFFSDDKTPVVHQIHAAECGAACLAIVLAHHGRWVAIDELRRACSISRDGCSAADIQRAAKTYGLKVTGKLLDLHQLKDKTLPMILFWEFNHFVVLEGIKSKKFLINDPANGHIELDSEEFSKSFTGVVLTLDIQNDFEPSGTSPSIRSKLWPWFNEHPRLLIFAMLAGLLISLPTIGMPIALKEFIDHLLLPSAAPSLDLVLALVLMALLLFSLTWFQQWTLRKLSLRVSITQSEHFVSVLLNLPSQYFSQRFAGDLASRTLLIDSITNTDTVQLLRIFIELVMCLILMLWMLAVSVSLAILILGIALLNVGTIKILQKFRFHENYRLRREQGKLLGIGTHGLRHRDTLRATGREQSFFAHWTAFQARELASRQRFATLGAIYSAFPSLFLTTGGLVVLALASIDVMAGEMTTGQMVAFYVVAGSFLQPVGNLANAADKLEILDADLQRVDDVLSVKERPKPSSEIGRATKNGIATFNGRLRLSGRLELRNISFGFREHQRPLIENLNILIEPGQRIALVGASGSGKSTVARLLAGIHEPWSGEILFDGVPRERIPAAVMTDSVAFVDQHVTLFGASVRDNLTLWNSTVPDHLVRTGASDAAIHDEIMKRRANYDALVREGGMNFSGGQRQRLEIARALVNKPALLILDEATSDLDAHLEFEIDKAIRRRGCSCLIVAHRLSTIRDCEEILVMDRGVIVQRGSHEELVHDPTCNLYRELIYTQ